MKFRKKFINNFTKIFLGIFSGIILLEISFKFIENTPLWRVFPLTEPILGEPDKELGFKFTPNAKGIWLKENRSKIKINDLGFRDFNKKDLKESSFKIILTGDSIVEALQVDQHKNFENLTEKNLLNKNYDLQIFNLAKSGDGPLRQLLTLEKIGYPLQPDLAILLTSLNEFYTGELLDDSVAPAYSEISNNKYVRTFGFSKRWQVRESESPIFLYALNKLQNYSFLRIFYYRLKSLNQNLKIDSKIIKKENNNEEDFCNEKEIEKYIRLFNENESNDSKKLFIAFLEDLSSSTSTQDLQVIYMINNIPFPERGCFSAMEKRKILINKLRETFEKYNIVFFDFYGELNNLKIIHGFNDSQLKFLTGHLN